MPERITPAVLAALRGVAGHYRTLMVPALIAEIEALWKFREAILGENTKDGFIEAVTAERRRMEVE